MDYKGYSSGQWPCGILILFFTPLRFRSSSGCLGDTAGGVCPLHGWIQRQRPGRHFWQTEGGCEGREHQKAQVEWEGHGQPGKHTVNPPTLSTRIHRVYAQIDLIHSSKKAICRSYHIPCIKKKLVFVTLVYSCYQVSYLVQDLFCISVQLHSTIQPGW